MKAAAKPFALQSGLLADRYEDLRAAVLGVRTATCWGLTVARRQGLARWMKVVGINTPGRKKAGAIDASQHTGSTQARAGEGSYPPELIPVVAQILAGRLASAKGGAES